MESKTSWKLKSSSGRLWSAYNTLSMALVQAPPARPAGSGSWRRQSARSRQRRENVRERMGLSCRKREGKRDRRFAVRFLRDLPERWIRWTHPPMSARLDSPKSSAPLRGWPWLLVHRRTCFTWTLGQSVLLVVVINNSSCCRSLLWDLLGYLVFRFSIQTSEPMR